jgi:hypothetical protein
MSETSVESNLIPAKKFYNWRKVTLIETISVITAPRRTNRGFQTCWQQRNSVISLKLRKIEDKFYTGDS